MVIGDKHGPGLVARDRHGRRGREGQFASISTYAPPRPPAVSPWLGRRGRDHDVMEFTFRSVLSVTDHKPFAFQTLSVG